MTTTKVRAQRLLDGALAALATGDADRAVWDAREALYPVSYDPTTGFLVVSEDN